MLYYHKLILADISVTIIVQTLFLFTIIAGKSITPNNSASCSVMNTHAYSRNAKLCEGVRAEICIRISVVN